MSRHCRAMGFVSPSLSTVASPLRVRPWSCCLRERPEPWVLTVQARKSGWGKASQWLSLGPRCACACRAWAGKAPTYFHTWYYSMYPRPCPGSIGSIGPHWGTCTASDEPSALSGLTADVFSQPLPLRILLGQVLGRNEDSLATLAQSERSTSSTPEAR